MQIFTDALPIKHSIGREQKSTPSLLVVLLLATLNWTLCKRVKVTGWEGVLSTIITKEWSGCRSRVTAGPKRKWKRGRRASLT